MMFGRTKKYKDLCINILREFFGEFREIVEAPSPAFMTRADKKSNQFLAPIAAQRHEAIQVGSIESGGQLVFDKAVRLDPRRFENIQIIRTQVKTLVLLLGL